MCNLFLCAILYKNRSSNMKARFKYRRIILIVMLIIALFPVGVTFSKYIYDKIKYYILEANHFYFNSDKLEDKGITYNINNWGGVDSFNIQFELNNHKNNLLTSDSDIAYDISVVCDNDVQCSISNDSGIIYKDEKTVSYDVIVNPLRVFDTGESVNVKIEATSSSPYVKTLSGDFVITVGKKGVSYEIVDEPFQPYFMFNITNVIDKYTVIKEFDNYKVGDVISISTYRDLSDSNKKNCISAIITLEFDPNKVVIDTTSNIINNSEITNTFVNGVSYVSKIKFNVEATSSTSIRFYKKDKSIDYTYPYVNDTSIISFDVEM